MSTSESNFTKEDFGTAYVEAEAARGDDVTPDEQATRAAQALARALGDLQEVEAVKEVRSAPYRIWVLLRITGKERESAFANGTASAILHHFLDKPNFEVAISKQLFPHVTGLQQKQVRYGWIVTAGARNMAHLIKEFSEVLSDAGPKLRVAASPLMGRGTPQGSLLVRGNDGRKGASPISGGEG